MGPRMRNYDCIVIGVGAVGSAALSQLAGRGARVLGLERFDVAHDRGSSHGHTRAIRLAYFEHPDYVPLLRRAFEAWRELDGRAPRPLYHETGILEAGPEGGELVEGVLASAREHGLEVEPLDSAALAARFPGLRLGAGMRALFEPVAGYLHVEECIGAMADEARERGAELRTHTTVLDWQAQGDGFVVRGEHESWRCASLILSQGAWAAEALRERAGPELELEVRRKVQLWYATRDERTTRRAGFVPFAIEMPDGRVFYGFPELDERGLKVAEHTGGEALTDPMDLERALLPSDREPVEEFLRSSLPGVTLDCLAHAACMYTQSPDGHFVVDRHPAHPRVAYAAGLSGHGFKFAPVLGEALADLCLEGGSALPIGFLSASRFA